MRHPEPHFFGMTPESLRAWCASVGLAPYRATQLMEWVYEQQVADPAMMTNLSKRDRDVVARGMTFESGVTLRQQDASDGTRKLLIQWDDADGLQVGRASRLPLDVLAGGTPAPPAPAPPPRSDRQTECVMIPAVSRGADGRERSRRTACISSQVGCPVGCRFCASGLGGLDGNLSAGRIVEQVWRLGRLPGVGGVGRISHVVFMGMGEPLANFKAVTDAVRIITAPWGLGISARRVTISTVGLPAAIERLADELEVPVTLALSLHAPSDQLRRELIPWAAYSTIDELLSACRRWFDKTGREVTLEYTLLREVNDRPEHARQLARVARTLRGNVNLIRYNEVAGMPFQRPRDDDVRAFQKVLREEGVNAHIRASRGRDISAACGQLRHERQSA